MSGFFLMVLVAGVPAFQVPMPDARTCAMNMRAMQEIVNDKAAAACFDMEHQQIHIIPKPDGEKVE